MNRVTLTLLFALTCISARAEFMTGNDLLAKMNSTDARERTFALAYVAGAHDAMDGVSHCTPDGVTVGQVHDLVKSVLERLPAERHRSADRFVVTTLSKTWPCEKTSPSRGSNI